MEIQSVKLLCFSPTGTTKAIAQSIAKGTNIELVKLYDITKPRARENFIETRENELLIVSVPVYMGRVPALINKWLLNIKSHRTPVVCVVVYGNRTYGNALLELKDILTGTGCIPVAGASFIGEHSFSSSELPIAKSRPNVDDLECAENFGKKNNRKASFRSISRRDYENKYPGKLSLWRCYGTVE